MVLEHEYCGTRQVFDVDMEMEVDIPAVLRLSSLGYVDLMGMVSRQYCGGLAHRLRIRGETASRCY